MLSTTSAVPLCCGTLDLHSHVHASARQHDQGVKTEVVDATLQQAVQAWLCDIQPPGRRCLGHTPADLDSPNDDHQRRAQPHVGGLGRTVCLGVPHAREYRQCRTSPSSLVPHQLPKPPSARCGQATQGTFLGRPPFAPFARALVRFASDRDAPPSFPSDPAMSAAVASAPISPCTLMLMS
jgi:hypothetical protein